jgi:shikimate dehydrogenase
MSIQKPVGSRNTVRAGLIGQGIGQSLTPVMHEKEGAAQGLSYTYERLDVDQLPYKTMSLDQILEQAESEGYTGLNITHPYKVEVVSFLDRLSRAAQEIGAANTIVFQNGERVGHNTDYSGFKTALERSVASSARKKVLLLGAGGAGGAVALALIDAGVENLYSYDRNIPLATALSERILGIRPLAEISVIQNLDDVNFPALDGVVNATPMGMASHPGSAVDPNCISAQSWVLDIVYFPIETELLQRAGARGCRVINGTGMAVYQAATAFELITGQPVDIPRFERVANQMCARKRTEQKDANP